MRNNLYQPKCECNHHKFLSQSENQMSAEFFSLSRLPGVSNVMNVPVSPVLAALVLTAAILFAVVCIVLATIYRKHSHKYVSFSFLANFNFHNLSSPLSSIKSQKQCRKAKKCENDGHQRQVGLSIAINVTGDDERGERKPFNASRC